MKEKVSAEDRGLELRRKTKKKYSAEQEVRVVLERDPRPCRHRHRRTGNSPNESAATVLPSPNRTTLLSTPMADVTRRSSASGTCESSSDPRPKSGAPSKAMTPGNLNPSVFPDPRIESGILTESTVKKRSPFCIIVFAGAACNTNP